jgi:hypothetical protein
MAVEIFPSISWGAFTWKKNDNFDQVSHQSDPKFPDLIEG